jgi:hypothetical protein
MSNIEEDDEQPEESTKPFCPKCGSTDIRVSQTQRLLDHLLVTFSLRPHRCRSCRKRFYKRTPAAPEPDLPDDTEPDLEESADSNAKP